MATEGRQLETTFQAAEDLNTHLYHAIALNDCKIANTAEEASGILLSKPESGEFGRLAYCGEIKFKAGGAISQGDKLTVATSGYFTTAESNDAVLGEAKAAVTSGSVGTGIFEFANVTDKRANYSMMDFTPKCTVIAGVAVALNDSLVANTGGEADGVALGALTSGTASEVAVFGIVPVRMDPAKVSSAGDALTVTTSGYFTVAASDSYICAKALANIGSNATGNAFFTGIPVYAYSSSFVF